MLSEKLVSKEIESILKLHINYNWSADEFASIFDSINKIYAFNSLLYYSYNFFKSHVDRNERANYLFIKQSYEIFLSQHYINDVFIDRQKYGLVDSPLKVNKIEFGSMGTIDLLGIGKIFEIIKDLIIHYFPNKERKISLRLMYKEIEEKDQKILELKIKNLERMGIPQNDIFAIVGFEAFQLGKITSLSKQGKLIDIEITPLSEKKT